MALLQSPTTAEFDFLDKTFFWGVMSKRARSRSRSAPTAPKLGPRTRSPSTRGRSRTKKGAARRRGTVDPFAPDPPPEQPRYESSIGAFAINSNLAAKALELKYLDHSVSTSVLMHEGPAGASFVLLNDVQQGSGGTNREGRQCTMRSVYCAGSVKLLDAGYQHNQMWKQNLNIFAALVLDRSPNGALPTGPLVFSTGAGGSLVSAFPLRNLDWSQRFVILDSVSLPVQTEVVPGTDPAGDRCRSVAPVNFTLSYQWPVREEALSDSIVQFKASTGSITDFTSNALYLCYFYGHGEHISDQCWLNYNCRLRFVG